MLAAAVRPADLGAASDRPSDSDPLAVATSKINSNKADAHPRRGPCLRNVSGYRYVGLGANRRLDMIVVTCEAADARESKHQVSQRAVADLWRRHEVADPEPRTLTYLHPRAGALRLAASELDIPDPAGGAHRRLHAARR